MGFIVLFETACRYCIRENEKRFLRPDLCIKPFHQEIIFVIEHLLKTHPAHMPVRGTVNRIAECYIVSGHRFRDGTGRSAHTEKPARHFLPRADLGKRPVLFGIQINLESLLVGADLHLRIHTQLKM